MRYSPRSLVSVRATSRAPSTRMTTTPLTGRSPPAATAPPTGWARASLLQARRATIARRRVRMPPSIGTAAASVQRVPPAQPRETRVVSIGGDPFAPVLDRQRGMIRVGNEIALGAGGEAELREDLPVP